MSERLVRAAERALSHIECDTATAWDGTAQGLVRELRAALGRSEKGNAPPDATCVTTADGGCEGGPCMHDPLCKTCGKPQARRFVSATAYCSCPEHLFYVAISTVAALRRGIRDVVAKMMPLPRSEIANMLTKLLQDTARGADMPDDP